MAQQLGYLYATGIGHDRGMTMAIGKNHLITHPKEYKMIMLELT
jgi:hypothetical protein